MAEQERVEERLEHIQTVEPILGALRTISLGSWQAALKQRNSVQQYVGRLGSILPVLAAHLPRPKRRRKTSSPELKRVTVLVIGSERGLVGRFNLAVVRRAAEHVADLQSGELEVERMALGTRVRRIYQSRGETLAWTATLPMASLPPFRLAFTLAHRWLTQYEEYQLDAVHIVYNAYQKMGQYSTEVERLIPPYMPSLEEGTPFVSWPPPIIETDPRGLYTRVVEQWTAITLYRMLLSSAAAEHSMRYQLMESASQNAERLISELTQAIKTARRHAITEEMAELAAGAGLIRSTEK